MPHHMRIIALNLLQLLIFDFLKLMKGFSTAAVTQHRVLMVRFIVSLSHCYLVLVFHHWILRDAFHIFGNMPADSTLREHVQTDVGKDRTVILAGL